MTEKLKSWWSEDGKWFCILVNDGVNRATICHSMKRQWVDCAP